MLSPRVAERWALWGRGDDLGDGPGWQASAYWREVEYSLPGSAVDYQLLLQEKVLCNVVTTTARLYQLGKRR
tara:strand:+ start:7803 stop:8018 length:216 start_codon:yes stop_codon:yes gene_type:complete